MNNKLLKVITVLLFTSLIAAFIIYRSGGFDETVQPAPTVNPMLNEIQQVPQETATDTIPTLKESEKIQIQEAMSSSKSITVIPITKLGFPVDTPTTSLTDEDPEIMSSSKSMVLPRKIKAVNDSSKKYFKKAE